MSNRSTWDGIPEGLHGDETTTGAQGLSSLPNFSNAHLGALRHGDKTTPCPKCGKVGEIIGNIPTMNLEGKIAAGADAVVICGCPMGTNRLISPAGQWMGNAPRPEPTWFRSSAEPEQHAQTAKKKRTGVDAGFCVVPQQSTTESFENILFAGNQPEGTRELYRSLNGAGKEYKAGSILLVVDPEKQDDEQIAHMKAAKARVDAALEPLTIQEANFLHKNKDTIDFFTSRASTTTGIASEVAGKYFEKIESVLTRIQQAYKNQYITSGALISEQFYVQRRQLFNELDSILTDFTRHKLALQDYPDIKRALGLSTSSITHRWNQTGVADIEGYATFIEKAAKYVKMMKTAGYVGIALDGVNRLDKIYEACSVGSDCEKTAYTEVGSFGVGLGTGIGAGALVSGSVSTTVCSVVLGALTIEAAGAGMLACGVIFTGAVGYAGGEAGGKLGEKAGEVIYEVTK
ncbi:PAAR domain-containing protein [Kluyvera ascorbata]|uniref:PAAR domain-containing protein n=1 Tax=Kluyvera ascorbata TaxID=51288 RepID=UPI003312993B|nr:PAAR domain-containing protein [Kluyvera ascorbata]